MKKALSTTTLALSALLFCASAQAGQKQRVALPNGSTVTVEQAACYNPETGRLEPCFVQVKASRAEAEDRANQEDACRDPVTGQPEPCF